MRRFPVLLACFLVCLARASVRAQGVGTWGNVQALPQGQAIRVQAPHRIAVCHFERADADKLECTRTRHLFFVPITDTFSFPRADLLSVKLSRHFASAATGVAIGIGAGAGIGSAVTAGAGQSAGAGAEVSALLAVLGAEIGGEIAGRHDFTAGPVIYRIP